MRFRKPNRVTEDEWQHWVDANRSLLNATGLPSFVFESHREWLAFLDHGYATDPKTLTHGGLSDLTPHQMASLLRLFSMARSYFDSVAGHKLAVWAADQIESMHERHR